jgi:hypothetical protein
MENIGFAGHCLKTPKAADRNKLHTLSDELATRPTLPSIRGAIATVVAHLLLILC